MRHYWVFSKLLIAVILFGALLFQPAATAAALQDGMQPSGQQWCQVAVVATQLVMLITATVPSVFTPRRRIGWRSRSVG